MRYFSMDPNKKSGSFSPFKVGLEAKEDSRDSPGTLASLIGFFKRDEEDGKKKEEAKEGKPQGETPTY